MIIFITSFLILLITPLTITLLIKSADSTKGESVKPRELSYTLPMKGFALLSAILTIVLCLTVFFVAESTRGEVLLSASFFAALSIPMLLESFLIKINYDETAIYCYSPWRQSWTIPWSAIRQCDYSQSMMWWILKTEGFGHIRIHAFLQGKAPFFDYLTQKTGLTRK